MTAVAFAAFIMWRWLKMKSDLKRALEEQQLVQQRHDEHEGSSLESNMGDCGQGDDCGDNISGKSQKIIIDF